MENSKLVTLGGSKLVPSVMELAKQSNITPPSRYIRSDQHQLVISNPSSVPNLPVIDMQKLVCDDSMKSELEKLNLACKEWGFFQLINHGVGTELIQKVKQGVQDFFELPMEEKKKFWQQENEIEGFGQAFVFSEDQKLDWADMFFMTTLPSYARKPHLFPKLPQPFRDIFDTYSLELKNLAMSLLSIIEEALQMVKDEITNLFENGFQAVRMTYYPSCPTPDRVIGLTPHSDSIGLTILLQINEMDGLQIKKQGAWIPIKPLPNAFIVNIGDILEIITNGVYHSIEHRAVINSVKERISIATFYSPRFDSEIGPAKSLINHQTPRLYKNILVEDYFKRFFARELNGKSYIDVMKISVEEENSIV